MEFYKLVNHQHQYVLEVEQGQAGAELTPPQLAMLAGIIGSFQVDPQGLPLTFRKYLTAYDESGQMEYIPLTEAYRLAEKQTLDGFATTFLEGEEENRVWIGKDGIIENRGSSGDKVQQVLKTMVVKFNVQNNKN